MATVMATAALSMTAFAGQWLQNSTGWWYDNGNGTWPANTWMWIDGNADGTAESYYFDQYGYCMMNTTTPDGYTVDGNGAWTVNGAVQTRSTAGIPAGGENAGAQQPTVDMSAPKANLLDMTPDVSKVFTAHYDKDFMSGGENWKNAQLYRQGNGEQVAYADFYLGGNYSKMTLKAVPSPKFYTNAVGRLEVINQETGEVLASKTSIRKDTKKFNLSADVSGVNYLRIQVSADSGVFAYMLVKDAYLY